MKRPSAGRSFKSHLIDSPETASHAQLQSLIQDNPALIASIIDHTLLRPDASESDVHTLAATTTSDKITETQRAIEAGASEIDMVINSGALKDKENEFIERQIASIVHEAHRGGALCKVIIETALLTDDEKEPVCRYAVQAGADFVKTSTGFSKWGATAEDVALMRRVVGPKIGVKASGGIRSLTDAQTMIAAGATRIGASSGVAIVEEALGGVGTADVGSDN